MSQTATNTDEGREYRSYKNRRNRVRPAKVPSHLTRTSAFVPRRRNLNKNRNFEKSYFISGAAGSVLTVRGGELGVKHRDILYAIMRNEKQVNDQDEYIVETNFRDLLNLLKIDIHRNNLRTVINLLQDLNQVSITVEFCDSLEEFQELKKKGYLTAGGGSTTNVISKIEWAGNDYDSCLKIYYGAYVREAFIKSHLVSLNAEVQFALKTDYAKTIWPWIDSQPKHHFIDESRLAELCGIDLLSDDLTAIERGGFRKYCVKAFDDMVKAGGLAEYRIETTRKGKNKSRRYYYKHALKRQLELDMDKAAADVDEMYGAGEGIDAPVSIL